MNGIDYFVLAIVILLFIYAVYYLCKKKNDCCMCMYCSKADVCKKKDKKGMDG